MQLLAVAGVVALVLAVAVLRAASHFVAGHLTICVTVASIGVPLVVFAVFAVIRGLTHKTVISWSGPPPKAPPRQLPAPVRTMELPSPYRRPLAAVMSAEEPEEAVTCDRPGCRTLLEDGGWEMDVEIGEEPDVRHETRNFCSEECAGQWQHDDEQRRAAASPG